MPQPSTVPVKNAEPAEKIAPIDDWSQNTEQDATDTSHRGQPFVLAARRGGGSGQNNMGRILIGAAAILVLVIFLFGLLSTKGTHKKKTGEAASKPNLGRYGAPATPGSIVPTDKMSPMAQDEQKPGEVSQNDIEKTKTPKFGSRANPGSTQSTSAGAHEAGQQSLRQVPKFEPPNSSQAEQNWTPPPYPGNPPQQQAANAEQEQFRKSSLVFVAHRSDSGDALADHPGTPAIDNLGLEAGFHVAARLETMVSTALHSPVLAIIEYNYERDGQILIPAGTRAIGKIAQADPSGLVNITFESLELPGGQSIPISAVAANTNLEAIKGQVTGKNTGRSFLVRSVSGIGEAAAMLVGQNNLSGAYSESDMLRQSLAQNVGNAGDEQVMQLMTLQHIVVNVPAGTEMYIIFTRPQAVVGPSTQSIHASANAHSNVHPQP